MKEFGEVLAIKCPLRNFVDGFDKLKQISSEQNPPRRVSFLTPFDIK